MLCRTKDIQKMATSDDDLLSEEHLDNIDNDNEGDDDVDQSSSDNAEMKKMKPLSLQNGTSNQYMTTTKIKIRRDTNRITIRCKFDL